MKSMTKSFYQSSKAWNNRGTSWKELETQQRSWTTTGTSHTLGHPKIWTTSKHTSPYSWLSLTFLSSTGQGDTQPNQMLSPHNGQTIWLRKRRTVIGWCYQLINSANHLSWVNHWQWMVMTLLMSHWKVKRQTSLNMSETALTKIILSSNPWRNLALNKGYAAMNGKRKMV